MADKPEFNEWNPTYEHYSPTEMGWVRVGERTWERPDGQLHIFPPGVPELLVRMKLPPPDP